jgi:hypothetical protein
MMNGLQLTRQELDDLIVGIGMARVGLAVTAPLYIRLQMLSDKLAIETLRPENVLRHGPAGEVTIGGTAVQRDKYGIIDNSPQAWGNLSHNRQQKP